MRETKAEIMTGVEGTEGSRVIGPNTVEYTVMGTGAKVIRFHHTNIVTFNPDGSITLNSGGWKTATTKERINEYTPKDIVITQDKSIWYVRTHGGQGWGRSDITFQDGITILPDGTVTGAGLAPKDTLKLKRSINGYVEGFMVELLARRIPKPSGGDCWLCGILKGEDSHLLSHIEEKYYVPRLLVNAIEEIPVSIASKNQVGFLLGYHDQDGGEWFNDITLSQVKKALTRYMYRHLGLAA